MDDIKISLIEKHTEWYEYDIYIKAGFFSGKATFGLTFEEYADLVFRLEKVYTELMGAVTISYEESDDFIRIISLDYGHLRIEAQLGGSWNDNWVKLALTIDQYTLGNIINQFKSFINS